LVASMAATCSAAASAAAAIDEKPNHKNAAIVPEEKATKESNQREAKTLKADSSYNSYSQYAPAPAATAAYHAQAHPQPYPVPSTSYSNPQETTMGFVYYYLPTVEKYYPKAKDILPYIKRYEPLMSRAWPVIRRAADRTFDLGSAIGLTLLVPTLIISTLGFLGFLIFLFLFPAVSAFGKRRFGRDVGDENAETDVNDFDHLLPAHKSRKFATLAARVDRMVETYKRALKSDTCLEKFSCEAGQLSNRLGKAVHPIIEFLEPYIPSYMYNKFAAFKFGARSGGNDCNQFQCRVPFLGN